MDEEERNYCCLVLLLTRVGLPKIRRYFIHRWDAVSTCGTWENLPSNGNDLLTKFHFKPLSYEKDKVESGDTTRWDLSLLVKALLKSNPPFVTDITLVKSLEFLKETRNTVCHSNGKITTLDFNKQWSAACNSLMVLGATKEDFEMVKQDVKQPWNELTSLMKQCANQDDEILYGLQTIQERLEKLELGQHEIKDVVKEGHGRLELGQQEIKEGHGRLELGQQEIKEGHGQLELGQQEIKEGHGRLELGQQEIKELLHKPGSSVPHKLSREDMLQRSEYLKASIKQQTEFQPKFIASHSIASARTDDIFTNLVMQHGRKSLPKGVSRREMLSEYGNLSGTPIERCQDIFITHKKEIPHPKSILVTGTAGIGKSIFCQRLARDWADGELFQEQSLNDDHGFDFVYLLTFRHLNLISEEQSTLREVLNRCSLLDEHSSIDESLFEYLVKHQDRVLFIIDGYDEYAQRESITSDRIEKKYQNNPRIAMPVAALVSKLLRKKIFSKATVMVTSRPDESNELGGISLDALVEIVGFSENEVVNFISKYFYANEKVSDYVIEHVKENEDLLSLAHVPMFCFLLCWCMEWRMELKTDQDLPVTMTELYSEFLELFELKHHNKSKYRSEQIPEQCEFPVEVQTTVEKLSKLAAVMMKQNKYIFEESDLTQFGLSAEEIEDLKVSGLLTSGPGLRISPRKITHYYCFLHLTLHEYLTALWYVQNNKVPLFDEIKSEMVLCFFAGECGKTKCEKLMEDMFSQLSDPNQRAKWLHEAINMELASGVLSFRLAYEYGDREFGAKMIVNYPELFRPNKKTLCIQDTRKLSMFSLNLVNYVSQKFSRENPVSILFLWGFNPKMYNYKLIVDSLKHPFCPITSLHLFVDFEDVWTAKELERFLKSLKSSKITHLNKTMFNASLLPNIKNALIEPECKITALTLTYFDEKYRVLLEHLKQEFENINRSINIELVPLTRS